MGRPKPELFLDRIVAAARPVSAKVVAVQRLAGEAAPIATIYESAHEHDGPLFGIERALEDATSRCLIVAVDYPLVTTELLGYLAAAAPDSPMVVPIWRGRPQPLCAIYDPAILPLVRERIASGRLSLGGLIDEVPATMIAEETLRARFDGELLLNVNTPAELNEAEALYGK